MRVPLVVITTIVLTIAIRAALILQSPELAWDAYNTLLHVQHIAETGLPLIASETAWQGAHLQTTPLFYYIVAFTTIFLHPETAALWVPTLAISLFPIPIYLLSTQLTKNKKAIITATLASAFIPILYQQTLITASPLTLAIPLFFLAYYYFIRLANTPKHQIHFIIVTVALTLTHPIALLLIPAMAFTILLTYVQRTRFSKTLTEVTLFTAFLTIWANVIIHKTQLQWHGLQALNMSTERLTGIPETAILIGVVPLIIGIWAAFSYLTEEKDIAAHALIALLGATILGMLTTLLSPTIALMIAAPTLILLTAGAIHKYAQAKRRARVPVLYTAAYILLTITFVITSAIPAIALGAESLQHTPTQTDTEILAVLPQGETVLWNQEKGYYLQYHGMRVPYDNTLTAHPESITKTVLLNQIYDTRTEIRLIQALNTEEITVLVLENQTIPIGDRCFTQLHNQHEVYRLQCVVR